MFCDEHYLKDVNSESKAAARNHRMNNKFAKFSICYEIHRVEEVSHFKFLSAEKELL